MPLIPNNWYTCVCASSLYVSFQMLMLFIAFVVSAMFIPIFSAAFFRHKRYVERRKLSCFWYCQPEKHGLHCGNSKNENAISLNSSLIGDGFSKLQEGGMSPHHQIPVYCWCHHHPRTELSLTRVKDFDGVTFFLIFNLDMWMIDWCTSVSWFKNSKIRYPLQR